MKKPEKKSYCDNVINPNNSIDRQIAYDIDSVKTGYNQACSDWEKWLPSEEEIEKIVKGKIRQWGPTGTDKMAKAIAERIGK